jgi:hypothetical protein
MKFEAEAKTEVYVNQAGSIAILQVDGDDQSIVWFSPSRARLVAAALIAMADQEEQMADEDQ